MCLFSGDKMPQSWANIVITGSYACCSQPTSENCLEASDIGSNVNVRFLLANKSKSDYFTTDGQSVCLGVEPTLGLVTRYYFLSECFCLKFAVLSLWSALSDEMLYLQLVVQSLNGPNSVEPVTILYCLI
jgi:hypothetical protein